MQRFEVIDCPDKKWVKEHSDQYRDPQGYLDGYLDWFEYEPCSFLYDNLKDEIVWSDRMEPEDASLIRDLNPLVQLLNRVADESRVETPAEFEAKWEHSKRLMGED